MNIYLGSIRRPAASSADTSKDASIGSSRQRWITSTLRLVFRLSSGAFPAGDPTWQTHRNKETSNNTSTRADYSIWLVLCLSRGAFLLGDPNRNNETNHNNSARAGNTLFGWCFVSLVARSHRVNLPEKPTETKNHKPWHWAILPGRRTET